jgi:GMP reductase
MYIDNEIKLDFKDVLIRPKRSNLTSRSEVDLEREFTFKHSSIKWKGVPIMVANMDTTGTFEMAEAVYKHDIITCIHKYYTLADWLAFAEVVTINSDLDDSIFNYVAVSSGSKDSDLENLQSILSHIPQINFICLDVANGYTEHFVSFVVRVRLLYPDKVIIAGSVVTREMTEELLIKGADIIKVGIGPGSVCTTRKKTGVGYPQLSAIIECGDAAHGLSGHILCDGGCSVPGDFGKAFGGGADFIMSGGMFSGHIESGGKKVEIDGKYFKEFYGMSSSTAMEKHSGGVATYRTSEGKRVLIPYKGSVVNTILDILGGLRSTCTYVGSDKLKNLSKRTTFVRVTQQLNEVYGK